MKRHVAGLSQFRDLLAQRRSLPDEAFLPCKPAVISLEIRGIVQP